MKSKWLFSVITIVAFMYACGVKNTDVSKKKKPNIIFIMSDDHTSQAISAYGGILEDVCPTPNIDRLANEGIKFNNCFVTNSICSPSRAAILTGKYAHKNGVYKFTALDQSQPTLPKYMKQAGYTTAFIGKYHLRSNPAAIDYFSLLPGQGAYHNPEFIESGNEHPSGWIEKGKRTTYEGHSSDIIATNTLDYLNNKRDKDKPFMLFCHFKAPHDTWEYAERYEEFLKNIEIPEPDNLFDNYEGRSDALKTTLQYIGSSWEITLTSRKKPNTLKTKQKKKKQYQFYMKKYLRCVKGVDDNVGRILDYLDQSGLAENTIIIYTGDQGFYLGEHGLYDKRFMYEEGLRMPFLVRWPNEIKKRSLSDGMILNVDFAPTIMDIVGIEPHPEMQGKSILPLLKNTVPENWRKSMYYRYYYSHFETEPHFGIRTEKYKLIYYNRIKQWELYDLENDTKEMNNLYNDSNYQAVIDELKTELYRLQTELEDNIDDDGSRPNIGVLTPKPLYIADNINLGEGNKSVLIRFKTKIGGTLFSVGNINADPEGDNFGWDNVKYLNINDGKVDFLYDDIEDKERKEFEEYTVADNEWHTLAFVIKGKSPSIYIDGKLVCEYVPSITPDRVDDKFNIGAGAAVGGYLGHNFMGEISDVIVYDEPLSVKSIEAFANDKIPKSKTMLKWKNK